MTNASQNWPTAAIIRTVGTLPVTSLEHGTPIEQISEILGHQTVTATGAYLKSSLRLLAQCALDPDAPASEAPR